MIPDLWTSEEFVRRTQSRTGWGSRKEILTDIETALDVAHRVAGRGEQLKGLLGVRKCCETWLAANSDKQTFKAADKSWKFGTGSHRKKGVLILVNQVEGLLEGQYRAEYGAFRGALNAKLRRAGGHVGHITGLRLDAHDRVTRAPGLRSVSNEAYIAEVVDPQHRAGNYFDTLRQLWLDSDTVLSLGDWLAADPDGIVTQVTNMGGLGALTPEQVAMLPEATRPPVNAGGGAVGVPKAVVHLDAAARAPYELVYRQGTVSRAVDDHRPYHTETHSAPAPGWAIFVMSPERRIYSNSKVIGFFHHSTFLGGGATMSAGCLRVLDGQIRGVNLASGHYKPGPRQLLNFLDAVAIKIASHTASHRRDAEYRRILGGIHVSEAYNTEAAMGPYYDGYQYWASGSRDKVAVAPPP